MTGHLSAALLAAAAPWLVLTLCLQRAARWIGLTRRGWALLEWPGAIALAVLLVPIDGLALARWVAGLAANVSIPFTGLLAVAVWEGAFERRVSSRRDWNPGWGFGALAGLALYPFALGVGGVDPYEWGWRFSALFVAMGTLTAWLIWKQRWFGYVLLLAAIAFHLRLLESSNYWDYLVDPAYCLVSLIALVWRLAASRRVARIPQAVP